MKAARVFGRVLNRLSLFNPLSDFAMGVVNLQTMAWYLTAAMFLAAVTALCLRARRMGERRALA